LKKKRRGLRKKGRGLTINGRNGGGTKEDKERSRGRSYKGEKDEKGEGNTK